MNRSHILGEIRRTAELNGGVPLGKQRFLAETGIRESDWAGKYWLRWSDAVQEAGYSPNKMNPAYADDHLFNRLAQLTRELDHFPLSAELAMRSQEDSDFPSPVPFRRFGRKSQRAARLAAWCELNEGWDDVLAICLPLAEECLPPDESRDAAPAPEGFVYLMKSGKYYKIGRTNSVGRREYELGIQLPEALTVVHAIATDDPAGIEAYWHQRFASRRKNGEWFELRREDVSAFRCRKFQ